MKFFRIPLAAIIFVAWAAAAYAAPQIAVDRPVYDFGSIHQGKKVVHVFTIRNKGDAPLSIKEIKPSCGCTAVTSSLSVIPPGKSGTIQATFDSTQYSGTVHKTIAVHTDDPKVSSTTLTLKGTIAENIQIKPAELDIGKIKGNETKKAVLAVVNKGSKPLNLTALRSPVSQIVAAADKKELAPGESTTIQVSITPRRGDRMVSGFIAIPTGNPEKPELLVPVYGSVVD